MYVHIPSFWNHIFTVMVNQMHLKPIFQWKLGLPWAPNANEIHTKNMKCTWPTQKFCIWYPTPPIFHWLASGVGVGGNANFRFGVGDNTNFSVRWRKSVALGVQANARTQREWFCVAVEYRLKGSSYDKNWVITLDNTIGYSHNPCLYTFEMDIILIILYCGHLHISGRPIKIVIYGRPQQQKIPKSLHG